MPKQRKYYAVYRGRQPGIYETWSACQKQVDGYPNSVYKSFLSRSAAEGYLTLQALYDGKSSSDRPFEASERSIGMPQPASVHVPRSLMPSTKDRSIAKSTSTTAGSSSPNEASMRKKSITRKRDVNDLLLSQGVNFETLANASRRNVIVLDGASTPSPPLRKSGSNNDSGIATLYSPEVLNADIEVLGTKRCRKDALPHMRPHCTKFPFAQDPRRFCSLCYCYICDIPTSQCTVWANNHCLATDKGSRAKHWEAERLLYRENKKANHPIAMTTAQGSKTVSSFATPSLSTIMRSPVVTNPYRRQTLLPFAQSQPTPVVTRLVATPSKRPPSAPTATARSTTNAAPIASSVATPNFLFQGSATRDPFIVDPEKSLRNTQMNMDHKHAAAFFLDNSFQEFLKEENETAWKNICYRLDIVPRKELIKSRYSTADEHFAARAPLVIEESRASFAQNVIQFWKERARRSFLPVKVRDVESTSHESIFKITFVVSNDTDKARQKEIDFLMEDVARGNVYALSASTSSRSLLPQDFSFLFIIPSRHNIRRTRLFQGLMFKERPPFNEELRVFSVDSIVHPFRQYLAVKIHKKEHDLPVLLPIIGITSPCPMASPNFSQQYTGSKSPEKNKDADLLVNIESLQLGGMNPSQEKATLSFLKSKRGELTVVQGPPGTGKTTLLSSLICRYLAEPHTGRRQLLVCAPTNKAIAVLMNRVYNRLGDENVSKVNLRIIGEKYKLLKDGFEKASDNPLSEFFVFDWLDRVQKSYLAIKNDLLRIDGPVDYEDLFDRAENERQKLARNLPDIPASCHATAQQICDRIKGRLLRREVNALSDDRLIKGFVDVLGKLPELTVRDELMRTADLIFCTLSCSASGLMFNVRDVDALIIDEAAAATEVDLAIPLLKSPSRVLIVGDPKQLPAITVSQAAVTYGLSDSLHDRLMNKVGMKDFIMLNEQYRMHPEISHFPANQFYGSPRGERLLHDGANVQQDTFLRTSAVPLLFDQRPYVFLNVSGTEEMTGMSLRNYTEAKVIIEILKELRSPRRSDLTAEKVRIITFYAGQVQLIQKMLKEEKMPEVFVGTVDASQGCESSVVLVSFVRNMRSEGFLSDDRRLNVAMTRAQHQCIAIGNVRSMLQHLPESSTLRAMAQNAVDRGCVWDNKYQTVSSSAVANVAGTRVEANEPPPSFQSSADDVSDEDFDYYEEDMSEYL